MEKIRSVGDRTSIIVVTGRKGRDVVKVVRDAIKDYKAHDTIAKDTYVPAEFRDLVAEGLRIYQQGAAEDRGPLFAALRDGVEQAKWDDTMMREAATGGGAPGLYRLIDTLFASFLPLVTGEPKRMHVKDGVAYGIFWSRGKGAPIAACFGAGSRMETVTRHARDGGLLLDSYPVGAVLESYSANSTDGVVYALLDHARSDFA